MRGNSRYWLFQAVGWGSFILIHLFFTWSFDKMQTASDRTLFFERIGIFVLLGLLITHIMRMIILRMNLLQKKLERQIWQFILLTLVFACIGSALDILFLQKFNLLTKAQEDLLDKKSLFLL